MDATSREGETEGEGETPPYFERSCMLLIIRVS